LSGGQRQRVAIARSLINDPSLILADEPTGNLDSKTSVEIMDIFSDLHQKGRTIVMITHDPEMEQYVDRVVRIMDGNIGNN
jgi:putative ABC transport system ATP-binding protein